MAEELYALPRADFTPTRDARAKEARAAGDRELAVEIGKLRKPTSAAWLANLLAREEAEDLRALAELGDALRDAQDSLDRDTLRTLSRQRHKVVHGLVQRARALARQAGQPVGESVTRELEETLTTALSDPDAAGQLTAGQLTEKLSLTDHGGRWFAPRDRPASRDAPPRRGTGAPREPKPAAKSTRKPTTAEDEVRAARIDRIRRDIDAARREVATAEDRRDRDRSAADDAVTRREEADAQVRDLRERLDAAEQAHATATEAARTTRRAVDASQQRLDAAQQRVDDLEETLRGL